MNHPATTRLIKAVLTTVAFTVIAAAAVSAQDEAPWWDGGTGGVIFNYSGASIDLENYQGGIGVKFQREEVGHRLHGDFFVGLSSNIIDVGLGYARERHLASGIAQPYVGFTARTQLVLRVTNPDSGLLIDASLPIAAGPILGVELRPAEFLGIFAEYELVGSISVDVTGIGGESSQSDFDFFIDAAMGNQGRIGVVVYFPLDFLEREDEMPPEIDG